ncbi:hypothetical protein N0V88_007073 [Collariella sp. IMI 366227]|nr:hypothetical protein N0V88_007073 [Collariella sp. IMI 366227]
MVKIAIAGPGQVAQEVIDGLVATGKHEILLLSRRDATPEQLIPGTTWVTVDYQDKNSLVNALQGVDVVFSFIVVHLDADSLSQKALIDAAIEADVKRIAPSEWGIANVDYLPWYKNKLTIRKYLEEVNKDKKVIEYTLFQPGWFLNYLSGSIASAKHVQSASLLLIEHEHARGRIAGTPDSRTTYTAIHDFVNIIVKAVDYEGEWPRVGGINGHTLSAQEEVEVGERVRGKKYNIETLELGDLKAGVLKTKYLPQVNHPSMSASDKEEMGRQLLIGIARNVAEGLGTVSDEWNKIFPDYKFTTAEEFLTGLF